MLLLKTIIAFLDSTNFGVSSDAHACSFSPSLFPPPVFFALFSFPVDTPSFALCLVFSLPPAFSPLVRVNVFSTPLCRYSLSSPLSLSPSYSAIPPFFPSRCCCILFPCTIPARRASVHVCHVPLLVVPSTMSVYRLFPFSRLAPPASLHRSTRLDAFPRLPVHCVLCLLSVFCPLFAVVPLFVSRGAAGLLPMGAIHAAHRCLSLALCRLVSLPPCFRYAVCLTSR